MENAIWTHLGPESFPLQCSSHISDMTSDYQHQHLHNEEIKSRMTAYMLRTYRISGKNTLSIDPLDSSTHSDVNAVQSVSGRI